MKLCLIHSLYKPYTRGGAEVVVEIIVKELLAAGHEVVLITLGKKKQIQPEGRLKIYRIKPFNVFSFIDINTKPVWLRIFWHPLDVFNLSSYFQVKRILVKEKPQAVLTHNLKGLGYLIPKAIRQLDIKHLHTVHDVQLSRPSGLIIYGQEKPFLILDKIYERFTRKFFGSPDTVISPSKWLLDFYTKLSFFKKSQKVVLQNPVVFKKIKDESVARPGNPVQLIYVGQIEKYKGILFLIDSLKKIKQQNWHLTIVGSGQADKEVADLISGDKRFSTVGRVDQEKLISYFRQSDLTVVPSLVYENSPKVIDESLVANVPVIAADIGGVSEMVKDGYNGFTFAAGNAQSLNNVLELFLSNPQKIEALKNNCFISVRQYSASNYIKRLLELI